MDRLIRATINTWHGLCDVVRSEPAFRQEVIATYAWLLGHQSEDGVSLQASEHGRPALIQTWQEKEQGLLASRTNISSIVKSAVRRVGSVSRFSATGLMETAAVAWR